MSITMKSTVEILKNVPSHFLRLDAFVEAHGLEANPVNLHNARKIVDGWGGGANAMFDLGAEYVPMLVAHRGSGTSHGIDFERAEMPVDPTKGTRASKTPVDKRKTPTLLMPAVRLVPKADWDRLSGDAAAKASLMTDVMETISHWPDAARLQVGDIKSVVASPTAGWALVTMLVKLPDESV